MSTTAVRRVLAGAAAAVVALPLLVVSAGATPVASVAGPGAAEGTPLTNLAHLDYLGDDVAPPAQAGHTTYRLEQEPAVGVLWTYAEPGPDGELRRVGGGPYDPATDTYGQGAFNADDVSRAAVVYLRHWRQTGADTSRDRAYEMLRGLTYLQTADGPDAGNVVLWMQPDGTLEPSPEPVELPDPSDSGPSYWLARTLWALGEGYQAFADTDPAFAAFLAERLDLSRAALDRQVLVRYGQFQQVDGQRWPAWLIADGADASAEAVLGLAAYVEAGRSHPTAGTDAARTSLDQLADGVGRMAAGDRDTWPFRAVMPWAQSRSVWHAWGGLAPAALATAGDVLDRPALVATAAADSASFTPWLLTSGGADNGRQPTASDRNQIAYGADSRVQSLLATADASAARDGVGFTALAGVAAAWFFGANAAGEPAYDPATGRTIDGIAPDGTVNRNSGAESTIHGLMTMLALDDRPDVAEIARTAGIVDRVGTLTLQAEDAVLGGGAAAVVPESTWTGEAQWGGTGYADVPAGGTVSFTLPALPALSQESLVMPVVDLQPGSRARTGWTAGADRLGTVRHGDVGPQGVTAAPGALLPVTLTRRLAVGATDLVATASGPAAGEPARVDAVMVEPLLSHLLLGGDDAGTALVRSAGLGRQRTVSLEVPGSGPATVQQFDREGRLRQTVAAGTAPTVEIAVLSGGFSIATR